jgi:poly(3-hydroxybutyrate) depolymerase
MNTANFFACLLTLAAALTAGRLMAEEDDVADTPASEQRVGDDEDKRYLLIRQQEAMPEGGYGLVVVLPGGNGSAEFSGFVRRIRKYALPAGYLVAEPIPPAWRQVVWPTAKLRMFTTEEFVAGVIDDVAGREKLDPRRVFVLAWSSGGPAAYAVALSNPKVRGTLAAMAIFKPDQLPALDGAKDKAFYVYHSPDDRVVPFRYAEQAADDLKKAGAKVSLKTYAGGHGWKAGLYPDIRIGIEWLEANATAPQPQQPKP